MVGTKIYANVGASNNSDFIEAAREASRQSLEGLKDPKVVIVFSTIHYEKNLKEMLVEIKKIIGAPIVGATGAAILTPKRIYSRGIGILCISGDLDVGVGVGKNSRTDSVNAGKQAVKMALENLGDSSYKNKYGIAFPSGMKFPDIPGMKSMMKMGISKAMFPMLSNFMAMKGTGPARYEEVLSGMVEASEGKIPIFGGGAFDDFKGIKNFQFLNEEVHHDSVVFLLISSNAKTKTAYKHGLKPTGKKMKITKARGNFAFQINGKPAWQALKEIYSIAPELENKWKSNPVLMTIYNIPAEKDADGNYWLVTPLCVIGDAILFARNVEEKTLYLCQGKGEEILKAAKDVAIEATKELNPFFSLVFSPVPRVMAMTEKIDVERQYIKEVLVDTPFLGLYCCASETFLPEKAFLKCLNETICLCSFGQ
ncbi:hypothetical protein KKG83_03825 [Candidatus Micrarchaeota archaeon]|nr:hypothetical protein [Candidatus Micrarchaeota archaeon]MBU2476574.1 hypothetical protein [Candidatus Micrarchaeota archaeon]